MRNTTLRPSARQHSPTTLFDNRRATLYPSGYTQSRRMLSFIKVIFIVIAGIFLVSFLGDADFSLVDSGGYETAEGLSERSAYNRSYDDNNDGAISDSEYRTGELARIEDELALLEDAVEEALEDENRSPYRDLVDLQATAVYADTRNEEYLTLYTAYDFARPINITGWRLKSLVSGRAITIPEGVRYLTSSRPWFSDDDIYLSPGDTAYISSGGAAGIKTSFLTNQCIGYLAHENRFTPSPYTSCPLLEDEDLARFDLAYNDFDDEDEYDECMEAIEDVASCERGDAPSSITRECRSFIREYSTYDGCVKLHKNDPDFLGDTWYIFLNANRQDVWREEREAIVLFDENGLIVDVTRY